MIAGLTRFKGFPDDRAPSWNNFPLCNLGPARRSSLALAEYDISLTWHPIVGTTVTLNDHLAPGRPEYPIKPLGAAILSDDGGTPPASQGIFVAGLEDWHPGEMKDCILRLIYLFRS
jgi:hypothetical protein